MQTTSATISRRRNRQPPGSPAPSPTRLDPRTHWQVVPGEEARAAPVLAALARPDFGNSGALQVVKTGPHRTVYRLRLQGGVYYLKHFHPRGLGNWLKHFVRATRAEHERDTARALARRGLRTIQPLAVGTVRHTGSVCESLLLMPAVPLATSLEEVCAEISHDPDPRHRSLRRQALAAQLGEFIGRLHARGGDHHDLHAGNLLVRAEPNGNLEFTLIDLQALRLVDRVGPAARQRGLASLHQAFVGQTTRTDRFRFWKSYSAVVATKPASPPREAADLLAGSLGWPPADTGPSERDQSRSVIRQLEEQLEAGALRGWTRADRAWARGNRHVRILHSGTQCLRGLATFPREWLAGIAQAPEQLFAADQVVRYCKQSGRCRVALVELSGPLGALAACVKCVASHRWTERWLAWGRWSLVRRSWETGHALLRRGIATPRPLFCIESGGPRPARGYLATEWIPDSLTAHQGVAGPLAELSPADRRAWLTIRARRLARELRRLHDCGFDHRDLKLANLLIASDPRDPRVWLLDLDGVRQWKRLPRQRVIQNLARLEVSCRAQGVVECGLRIRFLKWYLSGTGENWRVWWKLVERTGQRKEAQNSRRGRPIS